MSHVVDVIMPVYNAAPYLRKSIESILKQTFSNFQFIIIDDGSTDESWEILEHYAKQDTRIILLRNKRNSGICFTRNKWFAYSTAEYIVQMDADDISHPQRIAAQLAFMQENPSVGVCWCHVRCIDRDDKFLREKKYSLHDQDIRKHLFLLNPIAQTSVIIRKEVFNKTDWYDVDYIVTEDLQFRFSIGRYCEFANIDKVLVDYRIHTKNSSHEQIWRMIRSTINARRQAIKEYGYKPSMLWYFLYYTLFIVQYLPAETTHRLFYFFRSFI